MSQKKVHVLCNCPKAGMGNIAVVLLSFVEKRLPVWQNKVISYIKSSDVKTLSLHPVIREWILVFQKGVYETLDFIEGDGIHLIIQVSMDGAGMIIKFFVAAVGI